MKVVILAGGMGSRISEESLVKPKPMIEIGDIPVLCHIMRWYSHFGFNDFIICCGYKGYMIKEYFSNYYLHNSDITFDFSQNNKITIHNNISYPWKVTLVDTGLNTMTGGRIKRIKNYIEDDRFMLTYGDGLCDLDINNLLKFHDKSKTIASITAIQSPSRFGVLNMNQQSIVSDFAEKAQIDDSWINGGFMVLENKIFDYIKDDLTIFEKDVLESLAKERQLSAYKHYGFWQCMDTQRDKLFLESLWKSGNAPWNIEGINK
ncbi:MAG: glucose-1-phosphate cytidylyltransferase [Elusimicrobiota bacterium]|jgi:glucose-1-phosphate cytidylyltransferase|nr:glucose-1-phosphate cytidylyltransferase [Elusimicrobiota bacterium]